MQCVRPRGTMRWHAQPRGARQRGACGDEGLAPVTAPGRGLAPATAPGRGTARQRVQRARSTATRRVQVRGDDEVVVRERGD
jgi:hypothetical protein